MEQDSELCFELRSQPQKVDAVPTSIHVCQSAKTCKDTSFFLSFICRHEQPGSDRPGGPGVPDGDAVAHPLPGVEDHAEGDLTGTGRVHLPGVLKSSMKILYNICILAGQRLQDHAGVLERQPEQAAHLRVPGPHVRGLQRDDAEPVHGGVVAASQRSCYIRCRLVKDFEW